MKNRILSVFCAIAMIATMMSAFVVTASAADVPAVTMTVLTQATAPGEEAEIQIGYEGFAEGVVIKGMDIVIPLDTTKFTFVEDADSEIVYNAGTGNVMYAWFAPNKVSYITETSGVLGTFKLKLAEGVTAGTTYTLVADPDATQFTLDSGDVKMTGSVELSTGEKQVPATPEEPAMPAEAYVYAKVLNQPADAGEEVEIELSYGNLPEGSVIKGIDIVIPVDESKFTFVEDADSEIVYNAGTKNIMYAWFAPNKSSYIEATEGVIGTFKIKLADDVAWAEEIKVVSDDTATQFTLATGDVKMVGVASTIVVGAGAEEEKPVDPTPTPTPPAEDDKPEEPEKVPAFETEVETETKTVAGAKVNVFTATVAPAEGATAEAVSALIVDDSAYQVIFDGKTSKGYAAGWAMATVSGTKLKDALINGGALVDVQIAIGGADEVVVSVLDSEGNTIVLPEA